MFVDHQYTRQDMCKLADEQLLCNLHFSHMDPFQHKG